MSSLSPLNALCASLAYNEGGTRISEIEIAERQNFCGYGARELPSRTELARSEPFPALALR